MSEKLTEIEKSGDYANLQKLIQAQIEKDIAKPQISLQIARLFLNQGDFNSANSAMKKFDFQSAEPGEKLVAELQSLLIDVYRNQVTIETAGNKAERLYRNTRNKQIPAFEDSRIVHLVAQTFLIGVICSEFPPEKKITAQTILKEKIEELERSKLFDRLLPLRVTYSDSLDDVNQRLDELEKISQQAVEAGDLTTAGKAFCSQAQVMFQNDFPSEEILQSLEKSEEKFTASKSSGGMVEARHIRAKLQIERENGSPEILLPVLENYRTIKHIRGELSALMDLVHYFHENGMINRASEFQRTLIELIENSGYLMFLFNGNLRIADFLIRNGDYRKAVEVCEQTLAIPNIPQMLAATYNQLLGTTYFFISNIKKSDEHYDIARRIFEKKEQREVASNISILQVNNLDSLRQDEAWEKAEKILATEIDKNTALQEWELLVRFYEQLLQIKLNQFSFSPTKKNDSALLTEAEQFLDKAENFVTKLSARKSALRKGALLQLRGQLAYNRGDTAGVIKCWSESAEVYKSAGFGLESANSQYMLGLIFHNLANQKILPNALISQESLLKAIEYYDKEAMRMQAADAHYHLASLYKNSIVILLLSNEPFAELIPQTSFHLYKAEKNFDSMRRDYYTFDAIEARKGKQAIIQKSSRLYQLGLDFFLQISGDRTSVWNWTQRLKSRGLTDLLAGSFVQPKKLIAEMKENVHALDLVRKEQELIKLLRRAAPDQVPKLKYELTELRKMMSSEPDLKNYLDIRGGSPATIQNLEKISSDENQTGSFPVFIDWINVGKKLFLACFRSGSEPEFVPLEIDSAKIEDFYQTWLGDESFRSTLSEDYELLDELNPLIASLKNLTQRDELLVLVPTGILYSLPLHALKIGGEHLIERNPVVYEPSLSILNQCYARRRESAGDRSFALFGDPNSDRPGALDVVSFLAEKHKAELFLRENVTVNTFVSNTKTKDVIHFQGHAVFNADSPLNSYLKFADGRLNVDDIFSKLNLDAEIVSLLACESGVNRINTGDELLGLIPALIYAGSRSVLSTLWRVNEDSSAEIAKLFYSRLYDSGKRENKAEALRSAVLSLKEDKRFSVPYHWAGYVLHGDWQ